MLKTARFRCWNSSRFSRVRKVGSPIVRDRQLGAMSHPGSFNHGRWSDAARKIHRGTQGHNDEQIRPIVAIFVLRPQQGEVASS
jgi:hypothetical protein